MQKQAKKKKKGLSLTPEKKKLLKVSVDKLFLFLYIPYIVSGIICNFANT